MKNYRLIFEEKFSLISSEAHINQYLNHRDIFGSSHEYLFHFSRNGMARELHRHIDNQKWQILGKKLLRKDFYNHLLAQGKILRKELREFLSKINESNLEGFSDGQLAKLFVAAYKLFARFRGLFKTSRPEFLSVAENRLRTLLTKKLNNSTQVQSHFEMFTTPYQYDEINQESLAWLKIVSKVKPQAFERILVKHVYRFPWMVGPTYGKKQIVVFFRKKYLNQRKNLTALRAQVLKLKRNKSRLKARQRYLLKKFKSKEITYLSWLFQQAAIERMRLKGGWWGADFLFFPLYHEISKRSHVLLEDLYSFYCIEEVILSLKEHHPVVSKQELGRRRDAYVLWLKNRKLSFFSGKSAEKIINQELKQMYAKQTGASLKGKIASSGFAVGRVRILFASNLKMLNEAIKIVKKGEICLLYTSPSPRD